MIDSKFPIRVRVMYGPKTLPGLFEAIERWGVVTLGRGRLAVHTNAMVGSREHTLYFRSLSDAEQCFQAFAELKLRDWVGQTSLEKEGVNLGEFADIRASTGND